MGLIKYIPETGFESGSGYPLSKDTVIDFKISFLSIYIIYIYIYD